MRRASSHHSVDQLGHLLGEFGGEVVDLGDVLGHVVELPDVFVEGRTGPQAVVVDRTDRMVGHRLPPVVVDGPRPEHLEVLGAVPAGLVLPSVPERRRRS